MNRHILIILNMLSVIFLFRNIHATDHVPKIPFAMLSEAETAQLYTAVKTCFRPFKAVVERVFRPQTAVLRFTDEIAEEKLDEWITLNLTRHDFYSIPSIENGRLIQPNPQKQIVSVSELTFHSSDVIAESDDTTHFNCDVHDDDEYEFQGHQIQVGILLLTLIAFTALKKNHAIYQEAMHKLQDFCSRYPRNNLTWLATYEAQTRAMHNSGDSEEIAKYAQYAREDQKNYQDAADELQKISQLPMENFLLIPTKI